MTDTTMPPVLTDDPVLRILDLYRADTRAGRIDLGVGVYRTEAGTTPVLKSVKDAERTLWETQESKGYLGLAGNTAFTDALAKLVLGEACTTRPFAALQAVGGSGSLRLGFEYAKRIAGCSRVLVSTPTWENQNGIAEATGLIVGRYPWLDRATGLVDGQALLDCLATLGPRDTVLLHGCCHNPSGADLTPAQWQEVAHSAAQHGWVPMIDLAYAGFGESPEADTAGLRALALQVPRLLLAVSCSKNFGLYRERTGAVFVVSESAQQAGNDKAALMHIARQIWSMSPDHGAAIVALILDDPVRSALWRTELATMRSRLVAMRALLSDRLGDLANEAGMSAFRDQRGLFSLLPLSVAQVRSLREAHAVYLIEDGRINVAGVTPGNVDAVSDALRAVWH